MLFGFRPSAENENNFRPSLNPTTTLKVNGWMSRLEGQSFWLKWLYQINILSKLVELRCSYLTAFIFFYFDKIRSIFLVGRIAISKISFTKSIQPKIDCMGDLKVSTSVSWSSKLNTIGNILPAGSKWFWNVCFDNVAYPFSFK